MKTIIQSIRLFVLLTLVTGVAYPLVVTFFAHVAWSEKAGGSLQFVNKKVVGSELLSQKTEDPRYFWPRPSAADYATVASGASNLGPSSAALQKTVEERRAKWRSANGLANDVTVPTDMAFASGSGLDPHISSAAAMQQIQRVAQARQFSPEKTKELKSLVLAAIEPPQYLILGEARVNVLMLNIAVDRL